MTISIVTPAGGLKINQLSKPCGGPPQSTNQLETLRDFPDRHPLAAENDEFPYEIREKLVGLGSRPGYRAVFTIKNEEVSVLTVRAGEEDRLTTDDVVLDR